MVSSKTIAKNINKYAAMVGLSIIRNLDGSYNVRDNVVGYNAFEKVDRAWTIRVVHDALYAERHMTR